MPSLHLDQEPLRPEWLDAYGHLNEAYYLVPFSNATWAFLDHFELGEAYFEQTGIDLSVAGYVGGKGKGRKPIDGAAGAVTRFLMIDDGSSHPPLGFGLFDVGRRVQLTWKRARCD